MNQQLSSCLHQLHSLTSQLQQEMKGLTKLSLSAIHHDHKTALDDAEDPPQTQPHVRRAQKLKLRQ